MPTDRIPTHPPPRALHDVVSTEALTPVCGVRPRGAVHVTTNTTLVTCPRCKAALAGVTR